MSVRRRTRILFVAVMLGGCAPKLKAEAPPPPTQQDAVVVDYACRAIRRIGDPFYRFDLDLSGHARASKRLGFTQWRTVKGELGPDRLSQLRQVVAELPAIDRRHPLGRVRDGDCSLVVASHDKLVRISGPPGHPDFDRAHEFFAWLKSVHRDEPGFAKISAISPNDVFHTAW